MNGIFVFITTIMKNTHDYKCCKELGISEFTALTWLRRNRWSSIAQFHWQGSFPTATENVHDK